MCMKGEGIYFPCARERSHSVHGERGMERRGGERERYVDQEMVNFIVSHTHARTHAHTHTHTHTHTQI